MNEYLLKAASVLLSLAAHQLKLTEGNHLLANSIGETVDELRNKPEFNKALKAGLLTLLLNLEYFVRHDEKQPSISLKDPFKITMFQNTSAKEEDRSDTDIDDKKRGTTTLGKYIKRIYIKSIDDKTKVDKFFTDQFIDLFVKMTHVNILQNLDILDGDVEEKGGEDIGKEYRETEADSCMAGAKHCEKMELLTINPDKVSLVTMGKEARALLWTTDDGTRVLDRVYPNDSKYILPLRRWAEKQGYVLRVNPDQVIEMSDSVELSDGKNHTVTLKNINVKKYPYLDTFRFGEMMYSYKNGNTLILSNDVDFGDLVFDEPSGAITGLSPCADCGVQIGEYAAQNDEEEEICESCSENYDTCESCEGIFNTDNLYSFGPDGDKYCDTHFKEVSTKCYECEEYFNADEEGDITYNGEYYCPACLRNLHRCKDCGVLLDDGDENMVFDEGDDSEPYCDDCLNNEDQCKHCSKLLDYETTGKLCNECAPELETKQYKLPFDEDEEEINEAIKDSSKNVSNLFILSALIGVALERT